MIAIRLTALGLSLSLSLPLFLAAATLPTTLPSLPTLPALAPQGPHPIIAILPKGRINRPYPATTLIAGGTPPYSAQFDGALPMGMSISVTGALYGTPRGTGTFRFKIDLTDSAGATVQLSYALQIIG